MEFLEAFADELVKTAAAPEGVLHGLVRRLPGLAAVGGGGAAVGYTLGRRKGERQGIQEGVAATGDVAQRAYRAGLQRGAEAMREAVQQAGGEREAGST
jgi:hypothetical protein